MPEIPLFPVTQVGSEIGIDVSVQVPVWWEKHELQAQVEVVFS